MIEDFFSSEILTKFSLSHTGIYSNTNPLPIINFSLLEWQEFFFIKIISHSLINEPYCTLGGNANWYIHYGEQYGDPFKKEKLGIKWPHDLAIPLPSIYSKKP